MNIGNMKMAGESFTIAVSKISLSFSTNCWVWLKIAFDSEYLSAEMVWKEYGSLFLYNFFCYTLTNIDETFTIVYNFVQLRWVDDSDGQYRGY